MHGGAAERAALLVEEVAVRGVCLEKRRDLVDEPLEHGAQVELAAQHLRGPQERSLLAELLLVLREQAPEPDRESRFGSDRLEEHDVAAAPRPRGVAMRAEDADRRVLYHERRRGDGPRSERAQGREVAGRRLEQLGRGLHVGDRDGPLREGREARRRDPVAVPVPVRPGAGRRPLCGERQTLAEPHEAARRAERLSGLGHRGGERGFDVEIGSQAATDRREQPLSLERLAQGDRRPCALERDRRLGGQRLHDGEVVRGERPKVVRRRDGDDRDHPAFARQRHEGGALRTGLRREPRAHARRAADVVDREARSLVHRARDPRRLVREVETNVAPPADVLAPRPRQEAGRLASVLGYERERDEAHAEERGDLVEERLCHPFDVRGPRQLACDAPQALELALALGGTRRGGPAPGPGPDERTGREAERERAEEGRHALPREREAIDADGKRFARRHTRRADDTERRGLRAIVFRPTTRIPASSKDGPSGPLSGPDPAYSVPATGRCAPRRTYLALAPR